MATFTVNYYKFNFKIWDYFSDIDPLDNAISFRFSAYNPLFYMPSISSVRLNFNVPPQNCLLTAVPVESDKSEALKDFF
jgi:proprotein convertase subtilisin/kexin type 5